MAFSPPNRPIYVTATSLEAARTCVLRALKTVLFLATSDIGFRAFHKRLRTVVGSRRHSEFAHVSRKRPSARD